MRNNAKESGPEWNEETVLRSNLSEKNIGIGMNTFTSSSAGKRSQSFM